MYVKHKTGLVMIASLYLLFLGACSKEGEGMPEAQGGGLPTNYIILKDGKFSPSALTAVNGNSFTFVNYSGETAGIYSSDSIIMNKQNIAVNTSYYFKKDTSITSPYTIIYRQAGKPNVTGSITLTP